MTLSFADLTLDRPHLMGILNVTPDSFFDGGRHADPVAAGMRLLEEGASIVDVGGESTRPGANPVDPMDEQKRVLPVVTALARAGVLVSIDTRHATTMRAAIEAGAKIVNDVSGLTHDPDALRAVAGSQASVILMHMRGTPQDMLSHTDYEDVVEDVAQWLEHRVAACERAGIARERLAIDPGIGFAKTHAQSIELLANLECFQALGLPVVIGASRKGFLKSLGGGEKPADRLEASVRVAVAAAGSGAHILRVHDVAETARALAVAAALG
ncbi:MAG: folP [Alphaproteobacteria bacterium]|jgi:dihydropteroate synthase|nr:folP [Alphaproteobacteria bacterium]